MKTVLFICTGNYYRSRFAEVIFNAWATAHDLTWRASSSGLAPGPQNKGDISPYTVKRLNELGLTFEVNRPPRRLSDAELASADLIVALKDAEHRSMIAARHPAWVDRVEYWNVHDLDCSSATEALAEIERLVDALLRRLKTHST